MRPVLAPFFERVRERMSEDEFITRVDEASKSFDGLLDDEAVALLLLDEMGLNDGAYVTISELAGRPEATVRCRIETIEPPREFAREGRAPGRVANCLVVDATGEARVTLWDRDVEKTQDGTLKVGDRVTLVNARVKESRWGIELHVGPWTVIEVDGALTPAQRKLIADVQADDAPEAATNHIEGTFIALTPTRTYRRADGGVGFVCEMDVEAADGRTRVVVWDESIKAARALLPLAAVRIEPVVAKARGSEDEWHTTPETRMVSQ